MIQLKSFLNCIDNSGAIIVECIGVIGGAKKIGTIADEIVVSVKKARPQSEEASKSATANKCKKGDVKRAVIVRTRKEFRRHDGRYLKFDDNACVLLHKNGNPVGTRLNGVVAAELRRRKYAKVMALASEVV